MPTQTASRPHGVAREESQRQLRLPARALVERRGGGPGPPEWMVLRRNSRAPLWPARLRVSTALAANGRSLSAISSGSSRDPSDSTAAAGASVAERGELGAADAGDLSARACACAGRTVARSTAGARRRAARGRGLDDRHRRDAPLGDLDLQAPRDRILRVDLQRARRASRSPRRADRLPCSSATAVSARLRWSARSSPARGWWPAPAARSHRTWRSQSRAAAVPGWTASLQRIRSRRRCAFTVELMPGRKSEWRGSRRCTPSPATRRAR